ncbi:MAG: pyrroline-5-carboxylate reductase [Burkholderiaceae bacterium]|nr:pyrroline-5-carboxylate reductase [Burkholderiaceae bacterium]
MAQDASEFPPPPPAARVAFIGGGNLATALIGGLQREGALSALHVVEVDAARRAMLEREFGATTAAAPDASLAAFDVIVLAVKPQQMREACTALRAHAGAALLLSVAAGIRATEIARWCGTDCVVRAMPNTPALIGQGISGVAALPAVSTAQRQLAERILGSAGPVLWFDDEAQLDPVTAVSGSGPAYVFRFIEALQDAGRALGFTDAQSRQLALATFTGAAQLAAQSDEPVSVLRERVTSKGGTTAAALAVMEDAGIGGLIVAAVKAANARAVEMGQAFGAD